MTQFQRTAMLLTCLVILACVMMPGMALAESPEAAISTAAALWNLYDPALDIGTIDFAGVYAPADEASLAAYLWAARAQSLRAIPLVLRTPLTVDILEAVSLAIDWRAVRWTALEQADGSQAMLLACTYSPGGTVVDAARRNITDSLTGDDLALYQQAMACLGEGYPADADAITRERYVYDFLQQQSVYGDGEQGRADTAYGALLDGTANRLGYCDAFTMLCQLADIPALTVLHATDKGLAAWNVVQPSDIWYAVDASYGEDSTEGFPYLYFNAGLDMLPEAPYLAGEAMPVPISPVTDGQYAYGNAAFPELGRAADAQALRAALVAGAAQGDISGMFWMCDDFTEDIEAFFEALASPTADGRYMAMPGQGVQTRLGQRLYLQLPLEVVDLEASHEAGYDALAQTYDVMGGGLDVASIDFYQLAPIETEADLLALMRDARAQMAVQLPLRLSGGLDEQSVFALCGDFDWAMVAQASMPNRAGETHTLVTCTYLAGANIVKAHAAGDISTLTERELATYDAAMAFFDGAYPKDADAVTRERAIYDFVQASSDYWVGKPQVRRAEDVCSAANVLLDGRSNCAGFADAFWMLSSLAGFDVRNVPGTVDEQPHMWNLILLEGTWYMVDATKGSGDNADDNKAYVFYNAGRELMADHYVWNDALLPEPVANALDGMYPYGNAAFPGYQRVADAQALAEALLAGEADDDAYWMCDVFTEDVNGFLQGLADEGLWIQGGSWLMEGDALYLHVETSA